MTRWTLTIIAALLIVAAIYGLCRREQYWHDKFEAEQLRIPSVEEVQIKVGAEPDGIVGRETIAKWNYKLSRQIGDETTELCWTESGAPRK